MFDPLKVRQDFPLLQQVLDADTPLIYLDSAATSQKPAAVLAAELAFNEQINAAVHRGVHRLSDEATNAYEQARAAIASFIGAPSDEVVFTKNATESLNLVAYGLSNAQSAGTLTNVADHVADRFRLGAGDDIVITRMEHHANIVPWQELSQRTGACLQAIELTDDGQLDLAQAAEVLSEKTKVFAFAHVSNVLGTINPVAELVALARSFSPDCLIVLDACQSVPHLPIDTSTLGVDFLAFSGHKMLGPTGIGGLWGHKELLCTLPPFLTGGSMIEHVTLEKSTFTAPPARFEAGTPPAAQAVGLAAACKYLHSLDMSQVQSHDQSLVAYTLEGLQQRPWVHILGPLDPQKRIGVVAFGVPGVHPHDVGQVLDHYGIQARVGHHCAQPLHRRFATPSSTRVSFSVYNTEADVKAFLAALDEVPRIFGVEI